MNPIHQTTIHDPYPADVWYSDLNGGRQRPISPELPADESIEAEAAPRFPHLAAHTARVASLAAFTEDEEATVRACLYGVCSDAADPLAPARGIVTSLLLCGAGFLAVGMVCVALCVIAGRL